LPQAQFSGFVTSSCWLIYQYDESSLTQHKDKANILGVLAGVWAAVPVAAHIFGAAVTAADRGLVCVEALGGLVTGWQRMHARQQQLQQLGLKGGVLHTAVN
jgi:hypothetical protein